MKRPAPKLETTFRVIVRQWLFWAVLILISPQLFAGPLHAQENNSKRVALVIGNGAYENVAELNNPKHDSADLAAALSDVGFDVTLHTDQTQSSMLSTLRDFRRSADGAEIALIYFAGHGIEIDRQNYLLPVDAVLETDADVDFEAVKLETMIFASNGAERLSMVIVDACRNNPFASSLKRTNSNRSIGRGLSAIEPSRNTLVAYAAKEGTVAADGIGRNSPYASALITALRQPDVEIGLMMRRVRDDVLTSTNGTQEPFVYGSLSADQIYLNNTRSISASEPKFVVTDGDVEDVPNVSAAEIALWTSISDGSAVPDLKAYLQLYPDGFFADIARARIQNAGRTASLSEAPAKSIGTERASGEIEAPRALNRSESIALQEHLSALGHALGPVDGIIGKRTETAIRSFEKDANLPISGQATTAVLSALRDRVTEADLKTWRAKQAARTPPKKTKPTRTKTAPKAKSTPKPKVAAPKATAPKTKTVTKSTAKPTQFCAANKQCATRQCKIGNSGKSWRNIRACKFCTVYVQRCN